MQVPSGAGSQTSVSPVVVEESPPELLELNDDETPEEDEPLPDQDELEEVEGLEELLEGAGSELLEE